MQRLTEQARMRRNVFFVLLLAVCAIPARGQDYPSRPIRLIVPFPPSGGADILTRLIAQRLTARLGQSVIVDNRGGAGGSLGTEIAARAPADGHTLLMANVAPMAINVSMYKKLAYDPGQDFAPITLLASFPNVLVVHPSVPVQNVEQLAALARSRPGQLTYASAGVGSTTHLSAEFFRGRAKIEMTHVPYKGGGPALIDLLGAQVTMYFSSLPGALPHIRSGRLRALGVTSLARNAAASDIPTIAETGFPGFEAVTWNGAMAPAGVQRTIVTRLNGELVDIMRAPDLRENFLAQGAEPLSGTPEQFAAYIRSEIKKWANVVKLAGIAAQ